MSTFTIQSPLLVFDNVYRRTGSIERVCIFTNRESEEIEIDVHYDFPEHSWLQIYGPDSNGDVSGTTLKLRPGENEVVLSFNTDNFQFPERRFKGRVSFNDRVRSDSAERLEICFEHIDDLLPFLGYAAMDIGTSSSAVALFHIQRDAVRREPWSPRLGGGATIPSAVLIRDFAKFQHHAEGGSAAGDEALEEYRADPPKDPRCLQLSAKRLVGMDRVLAMDEKGSGGFVSPLDVLHALGRHLRGRTQSHPEVRSLLNRVSVTYPPTWSYNQLSCWKELFHRLGFQEEELDFSLDEASAAGLFYIYNCIRDRDSLNKLIQDLLESEKDVADGDRKGKSYVLNLLSFDFGGGTIDLALIEAGIELYPKLLKLRLSLVGSDSLNYGGDQVTLTVFRILKRRLAMALCDPARLYEEAGGESAVGSSSRSKELPAYAGSRNFFSTDEGDSFLLPDGPAGGSLGLSGGGGPAHAREASIELLTENWGYLETHVASAELDPPLDDAVEELFPTRFFPSPTHPFRVDARRNFDWLWDRAESVKKRLFNEVSRRHGGKTFPSFDVLRDVRKGISLRDGRAPRFLEAISWGKEPIAERILSAGADEVWREIAAPLEEAVGKARIISGEKTVDRVVLSGQSCRIPMVRWLLSSAQGEGGLGIPPARIEFDEENAKAGVSKGACLLNVLRETLVGFEVDIADFKANLLADIFYLEMDGARRVLFEAGGLDDFQCWEEVPEYRTFPKYLSIFYGTERNLIGQFLFVDGGEELPRVPSSRSSAEGASPARGPVEVPSHQEFLQIRERDRPRYGKIVAELLNWSERERIAWMEAEATPGTAERPRYRYYLTRNHNLFAVRDSGEEGKRLFPLKSDEQARFGLSPALDPFSGIH